jgi:hypothetical protein
VFNHLKAFPIELRLLQEQVRNRGFDVEVDDLFPPGTSNLVVFGGDEDLQVGTRAVGRAAQASVNVFFASIHESLSVMSLSSRSDALSLIV